ncbi:MAG TPA: hypothetical protein VKS24_00125 [Bradyrhizobium sp.]|nr:hypothetical protein [Bradyrhizobium sp.]
MATVAISTFSLGTGSRANNFRCENLSPIVMFIAFDFRDQIVRAVFFGLRDQMPILSEHAQSLMAS